MNTNKVVAKGKQFAVVGGLAGAIAAVATGAIVAVAPQVVPFAGILAALLTVGIGAFGNMARNAWKHRNDDSRDPRDMVAGRYRKIKALWLIPALGLLMGCATLPGGEEIDPKIAAMTSKTAAEAVFSAAFVEHRARRISDGDLTTACEIYDLWSIAQRVAVQMLSANTGESLESLTHLMPRTRTEITTDLSRAPPMEE